LPRVVSRIASAVALAAVCTTAAPASPAPPATASCDALHRARDYRGAIAAARDALARTPAVDQRVCLARAFVRIGREEDAIRELEEARPHVRTTLERFAVENVLGMAHAHLGEAEASRAAHNRALDTSRELRDRALEAASLVNLALGYEQDEPLVAKGLLARSIVLAPDNAVAMMTLAALEQSDRRPEAAAALLRDAVRTTRRADDQALLPVALLQLADVERRRGRHGIAIDRAHEALEIAYRRGDKENEALAYEVLADAFIDRRMPEEAFLYGFAAMAARFAVGDDVANERIAERMKDAFER
jgi:tetratricopeptide (TPR) repeat protein